MYFFLYILELIVANPMPLGLAKLPKTLTKTLPTGSVAALLATLNADSRPQRRSEAATGSNATAPSSLPHCLPPCAPMNCCAPTSVTFDAAMTGPSSTFAARAELITPEIKRRNRPWLWDRHRAASAAMSGEVVACLHVLDPARMGRFPPQQLAGPVI